MPQHDSVVATFSTLAIVWPSPNFVLVSPEWSAIKSSRSAIRATQRTDDAGDRRSKTPVPCAERPTATSLALGTSAAANLVILLAAAGDGGRCPLRRRARRAAIR